MVGVYLHHVDGETAFLSDAGEQRLDLVSDVLLAEQLLSVFAGEDEVVLEQVLTVAGMVVLVVRHGLFPPISTGEFQPV